MPKKPDAAAKHARRIAPEPGELARALLPEDGRLRARHARMRSDVAGLKEDLRLARRETTRRIRREKELRRHLAEIEALNAGLSSRLVEMERQNFSLLNLYVATYRLHGTLSRGEVLTTIREIITNLVGSEEMAIFRRHGRAGRLAVLACQGIDPGRLEEAQAGRGLIGRVAATGEAVFAGGGSVPPDAVGIEESLSACVPLRVGDRVTGAIAIFRLLQQKPGLEPVDQELLNLLATHAAMALYCTELHEKAGSPKEKVA